MQWYLVINIILFFKQFKFCRICGHDFEISLTLKKINIDFVTDKNPTDKGFMCTVRASSKS